jgi:hypothetical protein
MTIDNGDLYATGAHRAKFFVLDANGRPVFTTGLATTPYAGIDFRGLHTWDIPAMKMNQITHMDNDAPVVTQQLPPKEMPIGTLTTGINSMDVNAALGGTKKVALGSGFFVDYLTDKVGFGPTVGLFLYRWAVDNDSRTQVWEWAIAARAKINPNTNKWDAVAQEKTFEVALNKSKKRLYGVPLTEATDGALESAYQNGECEGEPAILMWNADGTEDEFLFKDENGDVITASGTGSIKIWDFDGGVPITTGVTKSVTKLNFTYPPASGHLIIAWIERA